VSHSSSQQWLPFIAVGPQLPGWGSWEWLGADLASDLSPWYRTESFGWDERPLGDVVVVVKHPLPVERWLESTNRPPVLYFPVDHYGSAAEIDADASWLSSCARIAVHSEKLRKYFAPYAPVESLDHYVKFAGRPQQEHIPDGSILWVGVRTNLPPLVEWANSHTLPRPLIVLTNPEHPEVPMRPAAYGFRAGIDVHMEVWSANRHLELLTVVSAAIDIKGHDFRSTHKPPAKAIDFLAAGVPLAMNGDSSSTEHLAQMGFDVADPEDLDYWLSAAYWEETRRFGAALAELLSRPRVTGRCRRLLDGILSDRPRRQNGVRVANFAF